MPPSLRNRTSAPVAALRLLALAFLAASLHARPSGTTVPLTADAWTFATGKAEFIEHRGTPAMRLQGGSDAVVSRGLEFADGTIEFDLEPNDPSFATFYFHWQSAERNECFYFRTGRAGNPTAGDAVQYAPTVHGINLWDLLGHYQGCASFQQKAWNHVKLVISGPQMRVYLNHDERPTLAIPQLEADVTSGGLAFAGELIVANLVVTPDATEDVPAVAGIDPTDHDPFYLRHWLHTDATVIPPPIDFSYDLLPNAGTKWTPIAAERRGLVNLTRLHGGSRPRRIIWLKTGLHADTAQTRRLSLGFSDEVWVFINGRILHVDKNNYRMPSRKPPEGRCSTENSSFDLPLQAGDNELLIGLANDFYGWGLVARIDSLDGITPKLP